MAVSQTMTELGTRVMLMGADDVMETGSFSPDRCLSKLRYCMQEMAMGMHTAYNEREARLLFRTLDEWLMGGGEKPMAWKC